MTTAARLLSETVAAQVRVWWLRMRLGAVDHWTGRAALALGAVYLLIAVAVTAGFAADHLL